MKNKNFSHVFLEFPLLPIKESHLLHFLLIILQK